MVDKLSKTPSRVSSERTKKFASDSVIIFDSTQNHLSWKFEAGGSLSWELQGLKLKLEKWNKTKKTETAQLHAWYIIDQISTNYHSWKQGITSTK